MRHVGVVLSVVCLLATAGVVVGDVHVNVPEDFPTIQAAIDSLDPDEQNHIAVAPGGYVGCLTIDRNVQITGLPGGQTFIRPAGSTEPVITVAAVPGENDRVVLRNLTLDTCENPTHGTIRCLEGAQVVIRDCEISGSASNGIHSHRAAYLSVEDCEIHNNADHGLCLWIRTDAIGQSVGGCDIHHNGGRGVWVTNPFGPDGQPAYFLLVGSVLHHNSWGGVELHHTMRGTIQYCTIADNTAPYGGGIILFDDSRAFPKSCIVANNNDGEGIFVALNAFATIARCDFYNNEGGTWSGKNCHYDTSTDEPTCISEDPLFANPAAGDYHLKSAAGRWDPAQNAWVIDNVTSPCIDANGSWDDVGQEPAPNGGAPNFGAYGRTEEASKTPADGTGRDKGTDRGKEKPEEGTDRKIRQRPKPGR